jgi:hypothetical protein
VIFEVLWQPCASFLIGVQGEIVECKSRTLAAPMAYLQHPELDLGSSDAYCARWCAKSGPVIEEKDGTVPAHGWLEWSWAARGIPPPEAGNLAR